MKWNLTNVVKLGSKKCENVKRRNSFFTLIKSSICKRWVQIGYSFIPPKNLHFSLFSHWEMTCWFCNNHHIIDKKEFFASISLCLFIYRAKRDWFISINSRIGIYMRDWTPLVTLPRQIIISNKKPGLFMHFIYKGELYWQRKQIAKMLWLMWLYWPELWP